MSNERFEATRWHPFADAATLAEAAATRIHDAARDSIAARGWFHLVLAGGDTPRDTYRRLASLATDWLHWHIWFGDERCVPTGAVERNSRMVRDEWLDKVTIPAGQIYIIPAENGPVTGARMYADQLRPVGMFDLTLLGLGEDGHTASLFPGNDWGTADNAPDVLAVQNAPKPPPQRISLSAARLARSRAVLFLVDGPSKHDAITRWREGANIPARAISPANGVDVLLANCDAAEELSTKEMETMNIEHDHAAHVFSVDVDGQRATLDYELSGTVMTITHTRVPDALGGRGIGGQLVRAALDAARKQGWQVIATCSFADAWINKHPEYADLRA